MGILAVGGAVAGFFVYKNMNEADPSASTAAEGAAGAEGAKKEGFKMPSFGRKSGENAEEAPGKDGKKKGGWNMPKLPTKNSMQMAMMKNGGAGAMAKMAMGGN